MTEGDNSFRTAYMPRRAALTGTSFDFVRMEIPCTKCGQANLEPLIELVVNDVVRCGFCTTMIDISSNDWRTKINEQADIHKQIKKL